MNTATAETTTTIPMTSQKVAAKPPPTPKRGFPKLRCILCGSVGTVSLEMGNCEQFGCSSCDETFTVNQVLDNITDWGTVVAWVATAPIRADQSR